MSFLLTATLSSKVSGSTLLRLFDFFASMKDNLPDSPIEIRRANGEVTFTFFLDYPTTHAKISLVEGDAQGCEIIKDTGFAGQKFENHFDEYTVPLQELVDAMHLLEHGIFRVTTYIPDPGNGFSWMFTEGYLSDASYVRFTNSSIIPT
eukprot:m.25486 g.25486  ORF g.25486 m.25486 type:complete len:149 (-) comp11605_c0_seq3:96-542(-)